MPLPFRAPGRVLGAFLAAVIVAGCSSSTHPRTTPASTPSSSLDLVPATTAAVPTTPAPPRAVPGRPAFDPQSVTFVSDSLGWAWGPTPAGITTGSIPGVLARTNNYGRTWAVVPTPGINYAGAGFTQDRSAFGVRFTDSSHGFLFGDALFATADSGITWTQEPAPHPILDLEAGAGVAYALMRDCPTADQCQTAHLYQVQNGGRRLAQVLGPSVSAQSNLVVRGTTLYLLSASLTGTNGFPGPMSLWARSLGSAWQQLATPCGWSGALGGALAAWSGSGLALVCGGEPSAGQQLKTAYSSTNGGRHWQSAAASPTSAGYVASLAAAGPTTWALGESRGQIEVTHDAGRTWSTVDPTGSSEPEEGFWNVGFTDAIHGVAVSSTPYGSVLAFTYDAAHTWIPAQFPGAG